MVSIKRVDSYATKPEAWAAIRLYEKITAGIDNFKSAQFNIREIFIGKTTWYEVTVQIDDGEEIASGT